MVISEAMLKAELANLGTMKLACGVCIAEGLRKC
jgi:hypothetical protein